MRLGNIPGCGKPYECPKCKGEGRDEKRDKTCPACEGDGVLWGTGTESGHKFMPSQGYNPLINAPPFDLPPPSICCGG